MKTQPYLNTKNGVSLWKDADLEKRQEVAIACDTARKRMGQVNISDEVYKIALTDLFEIINENYSWFSIDEIKYVLEIGPKGELGDNISMSTRTLATWFKNYIFEHRRQIAKLVREQTPALPPSTEPRKLTDDEANEYLRDLYDTYHETGVTFSKSYDILHAAGKIKNTKSEMEGFLKRAELLVKMELETRAGKGTINVFDYVNTINNETTMEHKIDARAKMLALERMFDLMKLKEKPKGVKKVGSLAGFTGKVKLK